MDLFSVNVKLSVSLLHMNIFHFWDLHF